MVEFNPRKKSDDKGIGKVNVDNTTGDNTHTVQTSKAPLIAFAAAGVVAVGLSGYFLLASGGSGGGDDTHTVTTPPPVVRVEPAPIPRVTDAEAERPIIVRPAPQDPTPALPSAADILQASIRAKESAIYRDPSNALYDAYLGLNDREVRRGQDFAVHVGLFEQGGVSVLITEGPYAGNRVGFFPVPRNGDAPIVTFETVGETALGADGVTAQFTATAQGERFTTHTSMTDPARASTALRLPDGTPQFEKYVNENGQSVLAFILIGTPEKDGVFTVEIFNGDYYTMDLNTGSFTLNSVFAYHPDYLERVERECTNPNLECTVVDVSTIPVISGQLDITPALERRRATGPNRPRP